MRGLLLSRGGSGSSDTGQKSRRTMTRGDRKPALRPGQARGLQSSSPEAGKAPQGTVSAALAQKGR